MDRFEEGLKIFDERCGNGKDNIIALATLLQKRMQRGNRVRVSVKWMRFMKMVCSISLHGQNLQKCSR